MAYVEQLSPPHAHLRKGRAHLELLRDRALMHLLLSSGMTKAEVASLDKTHIEDARYDSTVIVGRGRKERPVFWDAETRKALEAWLAARRDDYLPCSSVWTTIETRLVGVVSGGGCRLRMFGRWSLNTEGRSASMRGRKPFGTRWLTRCSRTTRLYRWFRSCSAIDR